jgi:thiamine-phosphate pyrophosphorylase
MAAGCQLYLSIPADFAGDVSMVEAALASGRVPSLLVLAASQPTAVRALLDAAHRQNAALVIENDLGLAKSVGADGVHLRAGAIAVAKAREVLGPDAIVGSDCGLSRHDAMALGEAGADYIAFGTMGDADPDALDDLVDMVEWWGGLIEIPCAAWLPSGADHAVLAALAAAGADFIMPGPEIWDVPDSVLAWVEKAAVSCRIERARAVS